MKLDIPEVLTIIGLVIIALQAVNSGLNELALAIGSGLVGYLTKSVQN